MVGHGNKNKSSDTHYSFRFVSYAPHYLLLVERVYYATRRYTCFLACRSVTGNTQRSWILVREVEGPQDLREHTGTTQVRKALCCPDACERFPKLPLFLLPRYKFV